MGYKESILRQYEGFSDPDEDQDPAAQLKKQILGQYGLNPPRTKKYQPLPAPEAESLKNSLLGAGGSLLGFIGGTVDKLGFRQIRALASGHLEDIPRSLIPFGGTLGLDDQSHNKTWDDILTGKGRLLPQVMKANDPTSWEVRDFVGPVLDTVIGPKIPKAFPLTAFGKAAQKANTLPRTIAQQVAGYTDDTAGLAMRGVSSPLPMNRFGGLLKNPEQVLGRDVLENLANTPNTGAAYGVHPINQAIAPDLFNAKVRELGLPRYTPGAPLRAGIELGFPGLPPVQFGGGPLTKRAAESLSRFSDKAQFGRDLSTKYGIRNPIPIVRNLFDQSTGKALEPEVQFSNITQAVPARRAIQDHALRGEANLRHGLEDLLHQGGLQDFEPQVLNYLRDRAEQLPVANDMAAWVAERAPTAGPKAAAFQAHAPRLQALGDEIRGNMDWIKQQSQQYGLPFQELSDDYVNYVLRRTPMSGDLSFKQSISQKIWNALTGSNIKRQLPLKDNPVGTTGLNQMSVDPALSGPNATLAPAAAQSNIVLRQTPDALRSFQDKLTPKDIIDRHLGNFDLDTLNKLNKAVKNTGLAKSSLARETEDLMSLLDISPDPAHLSPFLKNLAKSKAKTAGVPGAMTPIPALPREMLKAFSPGPASGGPRFQDLSQLGLLVDPKQARPLIAAWNSVKPGPLPPLRLNQAIPQWVGGRIIDPAKARQMAQYADILQHPLVKQVIPKALGMPNLRNIVSAAHPLQLDNLRNILTHRMRLATARKLKYGDEAALRAAVKPADIAADFANSPQMAAIEAKAKPLSEFLRGLDASHAAEGKPLFDIDTIAAGTARMDRFGQAFGANRATLDLVRRLGKPIDQFGDRTQFMGVDKFARKLSAKPHTVARPWTQAELSELNAFGMKTPEEFKAMMDRADQLDPIAMRKLASAPPALVAAARDPGHYSGIDAELLRSLDYHGLREPVRVPLAPGPRFSAEDIITRQPGAPTAESVLKGYGIPVREASEALTDQVRHLTPHEISPISGAWDSLQQFYKAMLYPIWPASQIRNYIGGMYNNWTHNAFDPRYPKWNPMRYIAPQRDMLRLLRGQNIDPLPQFAHLTPEAARIETVKSLFSNRIAFQEGLYNELGDAGQIAIPGDFRRILNPPATPKPLGQVLSGVVSRATKPYQEILHGNAPTGGWDTIKPYSVRGVGGRTEDANTIIAASREVGKFSEDMLRGGQGLAYMRQRFEPEVAGQMVRDTHFDYRNLADFEKEKLRKFLPFYTFTRKNLPMQTKLLMENPQKAAQTIRMFYNLRGNSYVPGFMGGGFAIPMGQEQDGNQRYLSQTGLPIEEAFEKIKLDNRYGIPIPDLRKTGMEYMGMLNPVIKGALEQLFDRQFFTGRRLSDLKPTGVGSLGGFLEGDNAQLLSQVLANTPASRFISTIDKIMDSRKSGVSGTIAKALNLATGFKMSDVDMERSRNMDVRSALEEVMRRNPGISTFTEAYIPPAKFDEISKNDPGTMAVMRLFSQMKAEAKAKVAEQKLRDKKSHP